MREDTQARGRAFWFPLVVFGLIVCASTPLYLELRWVAKSRPSLGVLEWMFSGFGDIGTVLAAYWLLALPLGVLLTVLWYLWYRRVTGLATDVGKTALTWIGAVVVLLGLPVLSVVEAIPLWQVSMHGTAALLVIAVGLWALVAAERGAMMLVTVAVYTVTAVLGVFTSMDNRVYELLGLTGRQSQDMPFWIGDTANVALPGLVLLIGGVVACVADLRSR